MRTSPGCPEKDDGQIVLIASPSGQQPATFALLRQTANEVVFENAEHDFPQRVIYRLRRADDMLIGRIEGTLDGESRSVEFPMRKADCKGDLA